MIGRVVEIAEDGRHLAAKRGFMTVNADREEIARIPLDDIGMVVANAHGITYSNNLLVALAERGAGLVLCGRNHAPVAWLWPAAGHHAQTARMETQIKSPRPLAKHLWQALVHAKVLQQAAVLEIAGQPAGGVAALARKVRSGDPKNVEAQAARRYWPLLMGDDFRRDVNAQGANALLNYGYTVLRAATARAIMGAGLHPSLGVHHRTRTDAFCLASDLMEPFRPVVDLAVHRLMECGYSTLDAETKSALVAVTGADMETGRGTTPLATCLERLASSLAQSYENGEAALDLPLGILALDAAKIGRI